MSATTAEQPSSTKTVGPRPEPVLATTSYDRTSAALLALVIGFGLTTAIVTTLYVATLPSKPARLVAIEIPDNATGGQPDGEPNSTLEVESELAPQPDAAPVDQDADQIELQETLEVITELADTAAEIVPEQTGSAAISSGVAGSADGSGVASLGEGPGSGGVPRAQRWLVNFADGASLNAYAAQLDYFGIELGVIKPDGTLTFVSSLAASRPMVRTVSDGSMEKRLYMSWQGGPRKVADKQLLQKAGVDASVGEVLHFYPKNTENLLALLEKQATNRPTAEIRRTYYDAITKRGGYEFRVRKQIFF